MTALEIQEFLAAKTVVAFSPDEQEIIKSTTLTDGEWREIWQPLIASQKYALAANLFELLPKKVIANADLRYNWAYALKSSGNPQAALAILKELSSENPECGPYKSLQAHTLLQLSRPGEAIALLENLHESEPENWHSLIALSNTYISIGQPNTALNILKRFIAKGFGNETVQVHAALAAKSTGRADEAEKFLLQAIEDAPGNPQAYHILADLYFGINRLGDAQASIDAALSLAPDDIHYKNLRFAIIERRASSAKPLSGNKITLLQLPKRKNAGVADRETLFGDLSVYLRVIWYIALRDIRTRESKSPIGIAMTVVEPLAHILALWVVMTFTMHGRPPLGEHWFFFYATGVLPFLMLSHLAGHGVHGHEPHKPLLEIPIISPSAILLGAAIAELLIAATVAVLLFGSFYALGIFNGTSNFYGVISAYAAIWLLGVGIMFSNTGLSTYFPVWGKAWYSTQRVLYFTSGIFYMAQNTPLAIREVLIWNPLLVGIEWFRNGFFESYEPPWLDKGYLLAIAGLILVFGVAIERLSNRVVHR